LRLFRRQRDNHGRFHVRPDQRLSRRNSAGYSETRRHAENAAGESTGDHEINWCERKLAASTGTPWRDLPERYGLEAYGPAPNG